MPDIEKLVEKALFTPEAITDIEDVKAIFHYFGYEYRVIGSHYVFHKPYSNSVTIPTVKGRHVKRQYLKLAVRSLELEVWYERRNER